ncbi:PGAP2-interacting protein-like [Branchiostoma floridae x Branchiostoma belcheri]
MAPAREKVAEGKAKKAKPAAVPEGMAVVRALAAETVLGFIFWSLLHGFGPMIWFYPLNELEISGYEAFVLAAFTPALAGVGAVFHAMQTRWGLALLRAVTVGCVASFQAPSTLARLVVLAMGNAAAMLVFVGTLWNKSNFQRTVSFWGLMLGFFALLAGRVWYTSLSPAWADLTTNSVVLTVGAVAIVDRALADVKTHQSHPTVSHQMTMRTQGRMTHTQPSDVKTHQSHPTVSHQMTMRTQGRMTHAQPSDVKTHQSHPTVSHQMTMRTQGRMTHAQPSDVKTHQSHPTVSHQMTMRTQGRMTHAQPSDVKTHQSHPTVSHQMTMRTQGRMTHAQPSDPYDYENPGKDDPRPTQRPTWVLVSVGFGSLLFLTQAIYGEVSVVSRWVVTGYPDPGPAPNPWGSLVLLGLANGLLLSSSDWLTGSPLWFLAGGIGGAAAIQFLPTYQGFLGGVLLAVYTTSVWPQMSDRLVLCPPGRTMVLALAVYLVEMFGMVWCTAYNFVPLGEYTRERTYILLAFSMLCIGAAMHLTRPGASSLAFLNINSAGPHNLFKKFVGPFLSIVVIGGLGGFVWRYNPEPFNHPTKSDPKEFTGLIWTFHFGYDNRGWPSFERAAKMLNETGADVITLLESDASKPYLGNNDLAMWLGERLDMYTDFGVSTRDHTWGNLLLSKYPIVKSRHHMLPSPHGELAPAISATINISGSLVDFITTHMGNDRDNLDRKLQAEFLSEIAKNSGNPVVFLGYVTSSPGSRDYRKLLNNGGMKDIDSTDRDRWCEYIMYKKLIRLGYARVSHGGLSDTEVQMAKFRIPTDVKDYRDHDKLTTNSAEVEPQRRFTDRFGSFFRGHSYSSDHHYHMDTPKYFLP